MENKITALSLWNDAVGNVISNSIDIPGKGTHMPIGVVERQVRNIARSVKTFEVTKQRTLVDRLIESSSNAQKNAEQLLAAINACRMWNFRKRRLLSIKYAEQAAAFEAFKIAILIVTNTTPPPIANNGMETKKQN